MRLWIVGKDSLGFKLGLVALLAYLPGFRWGLPHATHPLTVRGWAVDSVAGIGTLAEVHNLFVYPSADWYVAYPVFHYLFLTVLYAPYLLYLKLTGNLASPSADFPFGFADPETALRVLVGTGQAVSLLMAAATVAFVYHIAKTLGNRTAGVLAALLMMLAGPMVYYSRTGNLDVPVQFWTAAGLLVGVHALRRGLSVRFGLSLGLLAAVSVATKDQAYGLWIGGLLYLVLHHLRGERAAGRTGLAAWKPVAALVGVGAAGYAVLSGLVFWPGRFIQHVSFVRHFDQTFYSVVNPSGITVVRPPTISGYVELLGDLVAAIAEAVGPVPLILGVAGLLLARHSSGARFLGMALLGYVVLTIMPIRFMQYRYAIFPVFVVAVFAGLAGAGLLGAQSAVRRVVGGALLALAVGTVGYRAVDLTYQTRKDARYSASAWLHAQARPGDRIGFFGAFHQLPALPAWLAPVQLGSDSSLRVLGEGKIRYVYVAPDWFSDSLHQRSTLFPEAINRQLQDGTLGFRLAGRFETAPLRSTWLKQFPHINPPVQVYEAVALPPAP